jgi:hypothetical protein
MTVGGASAAMRLGFRCTVSHDRSGRVATQTNGAAR